MSKQYRIIVGSDDAGFGHKSAIVEDLKKDPRVASVEDYGVHSEDDDRPYPEVAIAVAEAIAAGKADRGFLFCGTGIGVAISANKVPGIRATVAHDCYSVERSVLSNDCQILTMGGRVIGREVARRLAKEWLGYEFDPATKSRDKVAVITAYEER